MDGVGQRGILDELKQRVLKDDGAGRDGKVLTDFKGVHVGLGNDRGAVAAFHIRHEIARTADQVFAFAVLDFAQDLGIGQWEIGGRPGIDHLPGIEIKLLLGIRIQPLHRGDNIPHPLCVQQIGLLEKVEERVFRPVRIPETAVAGFRVDDRFLRGVVILEQALGSGEPKLLIAVPEIRLCAH